MRTVFGAIAFFLSLSLWAFGAEEIRFVSYNVCNYFPVSADAGGGDSLPAKSPKQIDALIGILAKTRPQILGICEMGRKEDFEDFKKRLSSVGINYGYSEYVDGPDQERHLALLSQHPIIVHSRTDVPYYLNGKRRRVLRGILDVTAQITPDYSLRLVGVHLKSKRGFDEEGDTLVRRYEAKLVRDHVREILKNDPDTNLLLYGDFNDTKNEPSIHEIMGIRGKPDFMEDLWLKDKEGDRWTHYWKSNDIYSRIDYIFVNRALAPEISRSRSFIYRDSQWNTASDHRPLVVMISANDQKRR